MSKTKLRYQFVLFGDFNSMDANPNTIKILLDILTEYNMIPTTFAELKILPNGTQQQSQRISFSNGENGFLINFGIDKLDFNQQMTSPDGTNIDELEVFIKKIKKIISKINEKFEEVKIFNRLALITDYFMNIDTLEKKENIYKILISSFTEELPKEWTIRIVEHPQFGNLNEKLNNSILIERVQGQIVTKGKAKEIDDIKIQLDLNSDSRNTAFRFKIDSVNKFLDESISIHNNTVEKIEKKIQS